jgi:hypothetical protein
MNLDFQTGLISAGFLKNKPGKHRMNFKNKLKIMLNQNSTL